MSPHKCRHCAVVLSALIDGCLKSCQLMAFLFDGVYITIMLGYRMTCNMYLSLMDVHTIMMSDLY